MAQPADKSPVLAAFQRMHHALQRMAGTILGDEEDAEDALQDAFVRLWTRRTEIHDDAHAAALMTTTVRHLSIDRLRRQQTAAEVPLDEATNAPPDDESKERAQVEERFQEVSQLIETILTPTQRTILHMRDYEDRSYEEIAERLQMQLPAIRMQLSRARKAVRETYLSHHSNRQQ